MLEGKILSLLFFEHLLAPFQCRVKQSPLLSNYFVKPGTHLPDFWMSTYVAESFTCPICGPSPTTIICDGTLIGFKVQRCPKELTTTELKQLQSLLKKEGADTLAHIIRRLSSQSTRRLAPHTYRELFFELSLNTPICGIFQVAGNEAAIEVVQLVASGADIRQCQYQVELKLLQDEVPILASFLLKFPYDVEIPSDIFSLITDMCDLALAPFTCPSPFPPPTPENKLSFFPNLPKIRGTHCYSADQWGKGLEDIDACRKYSSNHLTLTPGIFTIYCPHGVCCGFEVMEQHESPRHPFEIFLSRFETPPTTIIYDNSCKLHQYTLNREPTHFKDTRLYMDRFH